MGVKFKALVLRSKQVGEFLIEAVESDPYYYVTIKKNGVLVGDDLLKNIESDFDAIVADYEKLKRCQ